MGLYLRVQTQADLLAILLANTGYALASLYTCRFGDWFGTPTCVAPCYSSPADPSNGHMNCSGTAHEESCNPTCARGYTAFGSYTCNFVVWYLGTSSVACYKSPIGAMGDSADNDASSLSCMFCQGTDKFYAVVIGGSLGFIFLLCLLYVLLRRRKRKNESKSKFELEQPIESNYKPMLAISSIHTQNPIYEADGLIQVSTFGKANPIYEADGLFQVSTFGKAFYTFYNFK